MSRRIFEIIKRLWMAALLLGIVGLGAKIITGERLTGYGSYVPWGLWIAVYFHAIGISGGIFAAGIFGYLRGIPAFRDNLRVILLSSAASLATGLLAIWLDLGRPLRAYRVGTSPNFWSMMDFNAWMYGLFMVLVAGCFYLSLRKKKQTDINDRSGWLVPLLLLGMVMSIAYPSQSGAFFGVIDAKPFWSSGLLPVLFLTSAITSGGAALFLVFYFITAEKDAAHISASAQPFHFLRWVVIGGVLVYFLGEFSEYSLAIWSSASHIKEAVLLVLFGPFWWVFWVIHAGGAVLGLYLLIRGTSLHLRAGGAFVIVATFIATRLNILIPGQSIAELKGLGEAFYHTKLSFQYSPTIWEYLIAIFIAAFGTGIFYGGMKALYKYIEKKEEGLL